MRMENEIVLIGIVFHHVFVFVFVFDEIVSDEKKELWIRVRTNINSDRGEMVVDLVNIVQSVLKSYYRDEVVEQVSLCPHCISIGAIGGEQSEFTFEVIDEMREKL